MGFRDNDYALKDIGICVFLFEIIQMDKSICTPIGAASFSSVYRTAGIQWPCTPKSTAQSPKPKTQSPKSKAQSPKPEA
jgi:hypothetical protein